MDEANARAGAARRQKAQGRRHAALQASMEQIDSDLADWSDDFVFGTVWGGTDIEWEEQMLVAIIALAVQGHHNQMRNYVHGALQGGVPEARLRAALRMLTVYAGFPVAIQGMNLLDQVVAAESRASS